jgi:hypothetical protein
MADVSPHLAFPLRVIGGRAVTVEQGSPRHLQDQAEVVLRTHPGTFDHAPDLGLRDLVATSDPVAPVVLKALEASVPGLFTVTEDTSQLEQRVRRVSVELQQQEA